jgi:hypothetical protein
MVEREFAPCEPKKTAMEKRKRWIAEGIYN